MMILMQMQRGTWILMRMATWRWQRMGLHQLRGLHILVDMLAAAVLGSPRALQTWIRLQGGKFSFDCSLQHTVLN